MDKNFERKLMNYLYFDLNRLRYLINDEIFEYDIQTSIHQFLLINFNSKEVKIHREKYGKVDHVIQEIDNEGITKFLTFIELKSFIKKHEKIDISKIESDIKKLYDKISLNSKGYLIIVIKEKHLKSRDEKLNNFINSLKNKNILNSNIDETIIKTRILRSLNTSYINRAGVKSHKEQVRLFMFQIMK